MHQFKEKSAQQRDLVSAGLFFYPVLMAADVLAYRANEVPVGDDQRQHVELMRDVAQRFNARFGDILVVPEGRYPEVGARIMDLQDPTRRCRRPTAAEQGTVYVLDDADAVREEVQAAPSPTPAPRCAGGPTRPGITNLIDILAVVRGATPEDVEREFEGAGYGDLKGAAADAVVRLLAPVRERYAELRPDEAALEAIFAEGAEKARAITSVIAADVRDAMGIGPHASSQPSHRLIMRMTAPAAPRSARYSHT